MRIAAFALAALAVVVPAPSLAQGSGGSFGGGSFGGGGGGGSGSGGGWSGGSSGGGSSGGGSSSSSWGDDDGSTFNPGSSVPMGSGSCGGTFCFLIMLFIVLALLVQAQKRGRAGGATSWERMDVTGLMVALDARARPFVQRELDKLAKSGATGSQAGLLGLLKKTSEMLIRSEPAWLYAAAYNQRPTSPSEAEAAFRRAAQETRGRFRHELVRGAAGATETRDGPAFTARRVEGDGVVVVTILVAARRELLDVQNARDANQLRAALHALAGLSVTDFVALEVIWSPAAADDRMSTAELETLYPELGKIVGVTAATGRVFCQYCSGPFAAELGQCPHCGAPVPTSAA